VGLWGYPHHLTRIDANRIVSYYDFDGRGNPIRKPVGSVETAEDEEMPHAFFDSNCVGKPWRNHGEKP
jgi:hypothetical protein